MPFDLRVIKTAADLAECRAECELLRERADEPALRRLELLDLLMRVYDDQQLAARITTPLEAIKLRMEERGLRQRDVATWLGGRNRVSEVLRGKRALTPSMIARLSRALDIPPALLLTDATPRKRATRQKEIKKAAK